MNLNIEESALILIDMQEKLVPAMKSDYKIIKKQKLLLESAKELKLPVIVTEQYPKGLGNTITELSECLDNPIIIEKSSFSCFGTEEFEQTLKAKNIINLFLTGIETHVCVLQTALDAICAGYNVFLIDDAVSSRHSKDRRSAINFMRHQDMNILSAEAIIFMLMKTSKHPAFKNISKLLR